MKISFLASGSSGNSIYIEGNDTKILIDSGISGIQVKKRMEKIDANPEELNAIVVTHEHNDHIKGVGVLSRRYNLPVFATAGTWTGIDDSIGQLFETHTFERDQKFTIGGIQIKPFSTSHDANDPVGFTFKINGYKIGLATDLGFVSRLVGRRLEGSNIIILESNHDVDMLKNGSYPWYLKQRILSRNGHLSNFDCNAALRKLLNCDVEIVGLAHLSKENNHPNIAKNETRKLLKSIDRKSTKIVVGSKNTPRLLCGEL